MAYKPLYTYMLNLGAPGIRVAFGSKDIGPNMHAVNLDVIKPRPGRGSWGANDER